MDLITQGLLGAAATQMVFAVKSDNIDREERPHSLWWIGALSAMSPDLDVIFGLHQNPMVGLFYHRHFTHSLFFIPIGSLLLTFLLWLYYKRKTPFSFYYKVVLVGMATHGFVDIFTSYGTVWFWPFSLYRVALDALPIVDLFFTSILLTGCVYTQITKKKRGTILSLVLVSLYTTFGFWQNHQASLEQRRLAESRGHKIERARTMPTLNNLFQWRSLYLYRGEIFADSFYILPNRENQVVEGESRALLPQSTFAHVDAKLKESIKDFYWFTDGWVTGDKDIILNARFSMEPEMINPIWGLEINGNRLVRWRNKNRKIDGKDISRLLFGAWKKAFNL